MLKRVLGVLLLTAILLGSMSFTSFASDTVLITTDDSRCKRNGTWSVSTNPVVAGPTGSGSWHSSKKGSSMSFDASGLESGNYGVYVFMTPWGKTADKMDVIITASGKSQTVTIECPPIGSGIRHWVFVGKYDFNGTSGDSIVQTLNENASEGILRASGVKFIKNDTYSEKIGSTIEVTGNEEVPVEIKYTTVPQNGEVIIGTEHVGFSKEGEWTASGLIMPSEQKGFYSVTPDSTGIWYPYINKASGVEVFYFKPTANDKEDSSLKVEVFASGETKTFEVDFTQPPTDWYSLGKYDFSGDGSEYVKVTKTNPNGTSRLTCLKFSLKEETNDTNKSAFYGTDLHILERMGMLIGEGDGITAEYLKKVPTRVQAAVMVLRLNGVDATAAAFTGTDNFADADKEAWAKPYLAYLKAHPEFGLIGTGDNVFDPTANIDEQAYAKILLTALGYEYNVDFTWDGTLAFAKEKGIASATSGAFNVNDLAVMTESIFDLKCKDGSSYFENLILNRDGVKDEGVYGTELPQELKAARDANKNKKRGIIYNNDGNDAYVPYDNYPGAFDISNLDGTTINAENFLKTRSYGLENTQTGTVMYCTGVFNSYTHESVGITDTRVRDWSRALKQYTGKDSLETMIDYVHSIDKEIFWSMRMNDTHDAAYEENELDPWKLKNMDKLMYKKADVPYMSYGQSRWSSVDYKYNEVRQLVYDILKDTLTRYDIDGLELDLTRWPIYFKEVLDGESVYLENVERMNNLVRMIRDMTEKISIERNKPILLAIYIPDSLGFCKTIGIDVEQWLKEDLIDIVSIGCHIGGFQTWEDAIKEFDNYDVQIYAAMDSLGYNAGIDLYEADRNESALAYEAGADGIYLYNCYTVTDKRFFVLGSKETCGPVDAGYVTQRKPYSGYLGADTMKYVTLK